MATGTQSFMGKALPIVGNATMTSGTAADDILTLTSATTQTGNSLVLSGINSSTANGIKIAVTSTGAVASSAAANANAILISPSSKANLNAVIMYDAEGAASASAVNGATAFLGVNGSTPPDYLLKLWGSAMGLGAAASMNMLTVGLTSNTAATKAAWAGIKCLFGSKAYYVLALPDTNLT